MIHQYYYYVTKWYTGYSIFFIQSQTRQLSTLRSTGVLVGVIHCCKKLAILVSLNASYKRGRKYSIIRLHCYYTFDIVFVKFCSYFFVNCSLLFSYWMVYITLLVLSFFSISYRIIRRR